MPELVMLCGIPFRSKDKPGDDFIRGRFPMKKDTSGKFVK